MKQFREQEATFVRLSINENLLSQLLENPLGFGQKFLSVKGEIFVDVDMYLTQDFVHWIQCMGASVEVIHPPGLRELIRLELEQSMHKYRLA
jgi:hypothetical protein